MIVLPQMIVLDCVGELPQIIVLPQMIVFADGWFPQMIVFD